MDFALPEFASYALNGSILSFAGAVCAYLGMSACFPKRNGTWLFWAYFLAKAVAMASFDAAHALDVPVPEPLYLGATAAFAVLSYFVLYYTWEAEFLKIGLAGMIVDLLAAGAILLSLLVVDTSLHMNPTVDYVGPMGVRTLLLAALYPTAFWGLSRFLAPLARWVRTYEFRHRKTWQALVVAMITFTSAGRFQGAEDAVTGLIALGIAAPIVAVCMGTYLASRIRAQQAKRRALHAAEDMMQAYSLALGGQAAALEGNRAALDALAARIERLDAAAGHAQLLASLRALRRECDRIRYGIHSDCPALDTVLGHHLAQLEDRGLHANVAVAPLGDGHASLAQAVDRLLEWAEAACDSRGTGAGGVVELSVSRRGNLCVADLRMPLARNANFPRRILEDVVPGAGLTLAEGWEAGWKTVRFMFEEDLA